MQALLFMAIFSLFMSIATNIVVGSVGSTQQLTNQRREETERFFKSVDIVINNITRNAFDLPAAEDPMVLIRSNTDLSQLSSGHWSDPTLDPWGNQLVGMLARENRVLYTDGTSSVVAPVTVIALLSPGPNRKFDFQSGLPQPPYSASSLQGLLPDIGSDDIVTVFSNEPAQRDNWANVQHRMERIAAAEMRYFQVQAFQYRVKLMDQYLAQIKQTGVLTAPDIAQLMQNDPNAPQFLDLNSDANRRLLGVDDDFAIIERTLSNGTRLHVRTTTNPDKSVTLEVNNDPNFPTTWNRDLSYKQTLKGNI